MSTSTVTESAARPADKFIGKASVFFLVVASLALAAICFVLILNVILRFSGGNVRGIVEIVGHLMLAAIMLALPFTQRDNGHIRITILTDRLGATSRDIVYRAGQVLAVLGSWLIAYIYLYNTLFGPHYMATGLLEIPSWPFRAVIIIGFGMWGLEAVFSLVKGDPSLRSINGTAQEGVLTDD